MAAGSAEHRRVLVLSCAAAVSGSGSGCGRIGFATDCDGVQSGQSDPSLIAHWKLDGDATDAVNMLDGAVTEAVFSPGRVGQGLRFDGVDDRFAIQVAADLGFNQELTVALWENVSDVSGAQWHFTRWFNSQDTFILAKVDNPTRYAFTVSSTGVFNGNATVTTSSSYPANVWHHLAGVFDGPAFELRLYVDGLLDATVPVTFDRFFSIRDGITIGGASGMYVTDGILDDARIYNRALTDSDVLGVYCEAQ